MHGFFVSEIGGNILDCAFCFSCSILEGCHFPEHLLYLRIRKLPSCLSEHKGIKENEHLHILHVLLIGSMPSPPPQPHYSRKESKAAAHGHPAGFLFFGEVGRHGFLV